ncbi:MAG: prenyltransferase [Flavobacteriales bacterium]|nr:prenyltransferase [Flavobacteriales bacterium]|tara:strand:- start:1644 stop:2564 length:921 start_codon:yes stop_codon:yes gene_type:complete
MVKLLDFFRLIRWKNLVIVALTQYLIRYTLVIPFVEFLSLNDIQFLLLVISTVLVAAAGYIINDYFDILVDQLNERKVIVGNTIKRREAMALHFIFSGLGVGIGFFLGWKVDMWNLGFINLFSASALWFYSTHFKRNYLSGNLLISLLSALVLLIVALYDILPASEQNDINAIVVFKIICIYAAFAFITTLIREIVKDLEDLEGDLKMGYETYAIVSGKKKAKNIVQTLSLLTIFGIAWILHSQFQADLYSFLYVLFFVEVPFLYFVWKLNSAEKSTDFCSLSSWIKIIMLSGTLSMLVFALLMNV